MDTAIFILPSYLTSSRFIECYETPKMHRIDGQRMMRVFVFSADISFDPVMIRFLRDLCSAIFTIPLDRMISLKENLMNIHMEYIVQNRLD